MSQLGTSAVASRWSSCLLKRSGISVPRPVSSLNYLLTSEGWRQEHNGYSHRGPAFINNLLTRRPATWDDRPDGWWLRHARRPRCAFWSRVIDGSPPGTSTPWQRCAARFGPGRGVV
ncbi:hypothetical protein ACFYO5_37775 [Streptomyces sp. NPDC006259]|uniref:hypothetical protein n=1 Tax=Streptomyces sp. NPDC006259 TaxID=3364740 RepID=UPI0036802091